jgi:protein tyrosine phosphatase
MEGEFLSAEHEEIQKEFDIMKKLFKAKGQKEVAPSALSDENRNKNRYQDILPYEDTRVKLKEEGQKGSDYINANYISSKFLSFRLQSDQVNEQ